METKNTGTNDQNNANDKNTNAPHENRVQNSFEDATADQSTGHAYDGSGLDTEDMEELRDTKQGSDVGPDKDITV